MPSEQGVGAVQQRRLGRVGHRSSVLIYGAAALAEVDQDTADASVQLALDSGINHFDVAASYGEAELRLGPWMGRQPKELPSNTTGGSPVASSQSARCPACSATFRTRPGSPLSPKPGRSITWTGRGWRVGPPMASSSCGKRPGCGPGPAAEWRRDWHAGCGHGEVIPRRPMSVCCAAQLRTQPLVAWGRHARAVSQPQPRRNLVLLGVLA